MAPLEPIAHPGAGPVSPFDSSTILALFTAAWERGEGPVAEQYLGRLDPADSRAEVDLIYREYCLAEQAGHEPSVSQYVGRFPRHEAALVRLLQLHRECPPSLLGRWMQTTSGDDALPKVGDEIGPFFLRRELGSGGFARVFLAEQTNLENRLVRSRAIFVLAGSGGRISVNPGLLIDVKIFGGPQRAQSIRGLMIRNGAMQPLRSHVRDRSPQVSEGMRQVRWRYVSSQIKIEKQRVAIGRQEDVRWFHVAVRHSAACGVIKSFSEPGHKPRHRLIVGEPGQDLSRRPHGMYGGKLGRGHAVECRQQIVTRRRAPPAVACRTQDRGQRRPAPEGHADQVKCAIVDRRV
jgi:hypothetical protein